MPAGVFRLRIEAIMTAIGETRLLPITLVDELKCVHATLRTAREINPKHPVIPKQPHPIDCDVCSAGRRVDLLLDRISQAIGRKPA